MNNERQWITGKEGKNIVCNKDYNSKPKIGQSVRQFQFLIKLSFNLQMHWCITFKIYGMYSIYIFIYLYTKYKASGSNIEGEIQSK